MKEKVTIKPYVRAYDEALMKLSVTEEQSVYVGNVDDLLNDKKEGWTYHVIFYGERIVGFFNIDLLYHKQYDFAGEGDLGFRAFFIDSRYQGLGIGSQTLSQLKTYVGNRFSNWDSLVLTVNCRNKTAYELYRKYDFKDDGELYYGGKAGPQHVLRMSRHPDKLSKY